MDQAEEQSPQDLMERLIAAEQGTPIDDEPETEAVEAETEAEETEAEATDETDSQEEPEEPRNFKLKRGDEEVEVPEEEVILLAQQGYDYTKKTQALAEERKTVEERAQAIAAQEQILKQQTELQQALFKDMAKVEALNDQIAEYDKVDWQSLSDTDPVQAQKLFFAYTQLNNKRNALTQEVNAKAVQEQQLRQHKVQQSLAEAYKQLSRDIPGWSADKARSIRDAAKSYGYSDTELEAVYDPRLVRLMHDAAQFRALQSTKPQVTNKVANKPPVVKPGGKDAKVVAKSKYTEERNQLRKSGDKNLAAQIIERML